MLSILINSNKIFFSRNDMSIITTDPISLFTDIRFSVCIADIFSYLETFIKGLSAQKWAMSMPLARAARYRESELMEQTLQVKRCSVS